MWLTSRNHDLHVGDLILDLKKLGQDHGANLPTSNKTDFKDWVRLLDTLFEVNGDFVRSIGFRHVDVKLCTLLTIGPSS